MTRMNLNSDKGPLQQCGTMPPPVKRLVEVPSTWLPTLVVVIDSEEEFNWNEPFNADNTSVENIALQLLSQGILDKYGVVPTYVVDYPVATTPAAVSVLRQIFAEGRCDVGAHLHPWVNPPVEGPVDVYHSYPGNLPAATERRKLVALTEVIAENFGVAPRIYKAGRYGIGVATPGILRKLDYAMDVSVVPYTDFSGDGGPDFRGTPSAPFLTDYNICELPLSVHFAGVLARLGGRFFPLLETNAARRLRLGGIFGRLGILERLRLTPEGHTLEDMIRQTRAALALGTRLFMLTYHSSSLLPGATPYVRNDAEQSAFLEALDGYFHHFMHEVGGRAGTVAGVASALVPEIFACKNSAAKLDSELRGSKNVSEARF